MSALDDVVTFLKSGVAAINRLNTTIGSVFPQQGATSPTATTGAGTLPAKPVGFINVTLLDGTQAKVPYYNV